MLNRLFINHVLTKPDNVAKAIYMSYKGISPVIANEIVYRSGVSKDNTDALSLAEKDELFKGSKLIIETEKAATYCEGCKKTYETVKYGRKCPYCGSDETYLLYGNEVYIKEIEAE